MCEPLQAPRPPQRHIPLVHVSPCIDTVQSMHMRPMSPQLVGLAGWQTLPAQQPLGHDIASHTHAPPMHRCPVPHAAPAPHRHEPPVHESAPVPHETHDAPMRPHARRVGGVTHVEPEQHPVAHEVGVQPLQTPPEHVPAPHDVHAAPPVPHALAEVPATHVAP
jgi:hypothetical protein